MFMILKSNSTAKYHLTMAIRYLQVLSNSLINATKLHSEVTYWIDTLDMIRDCLYEEYECNTIEMLRSIREIQSELTNAYSFIKYEIDRKQLSHLSNAWLNCKQAGDSLGD